MMELSLDYNGVKEYSCVEYPLLMIDYAECVIPGRSAVAVKNLTNNEWFFQCHFPGNPVMPGTLEMEAIFQTAALAVHTLPGNKEKTSYLVRANNLMYLGFAHPGDTLRIKAELKRWKHGVGSGHGEITVKDKIVCKIDFTLAILEDMEDMK
ncbi:(3R)-hydroxymyristoyl-[acyl-carrier-protein] dehydratase [Centipeda periodontii DSM 2778]|uniref:(3R)-hydroxymyristoyl-[acyl-carrier-protein] dehydratase n=1 Tax=Centipeda periodontii DSM 2778 TaxID=888060 RepID=F5RII4_9FIRM|nr:3-hydroxyacyl-ACP dehydratase FabZ family protein [Centipeda periodontii]EGK62593.1 (3R)-hydroxymyristoyl-[acyl-carrier-protein] dehydratase [Centipeda periodontii DSM 2778]